jgi:hypothetical protein
MSQGNRDIDTIINRIKELDSLVDILQLEAKYSGDDDGIWYFRLDGAEVQVESSDGMSPFLIEGDKESQVVSNANIDMTISSICEFLGINGG